MSEVNDAVRASLFVTDYNVRDMFGKRQAPEMELTEMLEQARAEGYRAGLEAAAKCAEEFCPDGGYDVETAAGMAAYDAGDNIAAAIRALAKEA